MRLSSATRWVPKNQKIANEKDGIHSSCILNDSAYFYVTENRSLNSMHDILEGVGPFVVLLSLRSYNTRHPEYGINAQLLNS